MKKYTFTDIEDGAVHEFDTLEEVYAFDHWAAVVFDVMIDDGKTDYTGVVSKYHIEKPQWYN